MAQRRMISLEVIDTDAFLDMPVSSQLLYFHLNARADDDGFVANPRKVLRTLGGSLDDYRVLIGKKFLIEFEDGVCVIKHWRINNFVRKDIYKETKYLDLKNTLLIRPNGAYTLTDDGQAVPVPKGHFKLEDVNVTSTQRQLSIGKDRLGKDSIEYGAKAPTPSQIARSFFDMGEHYHEIRQQFTDKVPEQVLDRELQKFILYWTEPNKSGTKVRWQQQSTFDVKRRIVTWLGNANFNRSETSQGRGLA